ncbi:non-homologous end joining protein Ku [Archaeoglobus neptunius]|uniref:non-homologous end joining protein Ku n=1 Tax=Archaeoglobus neptunius TaxID=2798580 RepID=UPI001927C595|nr:Ku protein [Archaeoglobus neptunius]
MRATWKGNISFGLVTIPVKVYSAVLPKEIKFNLLHSADGGRIRYRKVCEKCGREVSSDEIVRGFEVSKNEYVILTDEDFEKIPLNTVRTIEIKQFFQPEELGIIYYSNFYYVVPDKGGEKAYYLLKRAMIETESMAAGKMSMRGRENLVALKAFDGGLLLATLHYIDEIRNPYEVAGWGTEVEVSSEELDLAKKLILAMKKPLKIEEYRDEYKEALMQLIDAKLAGKEIAVTGGVEEVESLMDALKASLESVKGA